jgi:hypothetical protein
LDVRQHKSFNEYQNKKSMNLLMSNRIKYQYYLKLISYKLVIIPIVYNYIYIYNYVINTSEIIFISDVLDLLDYYQTVINNTLLIDT